MFGFEGTNFQMAQWLSWLERRPVTAKVVGSSPIWVVIGDFLDVSAVHSKPLFEVNGNLPEGWQHQPGENSVLGVVDETVERLSKYMMLRQGDLLFVPALGCPFEISPDMHLEGRIGERRVLEFNIK